MRADCCDDCPGCGRCLCAGCDGTIDCVDCACDDVPVAGEPGRVHALRTKKCVRCGQRTHPEDFTDPPEPGGWTGVCLLCFEAESSLMKPLRDRVVVMIDRYVGTERESCGNRSMDGINVCGRQAGHDGPHIKFGLNYTASWGRRLAP